MLFAVRFFDKPELLALRNENLAAHIAWLDAHREQILVGGSLRENLDQNAIGGLWLVEAESREVIERLIETDPFWIIGLREHYEIHYWCKAFPERRTLI
jgi:hypothetical protein